MQPQINEKEAEIGIGGIGIPAEVLFHPTLTAIEQKLFGLVRNISKSERGCWATNRWLSDLLNVNPSTISGYVSNLQKEGFFIVKFVKKPRTTTNETERRIYIDNSYPVKYRKLVESVNKAVYDGTFAAKDFFGKDAKTTPLLSETYPPTTQGEGGYDTGRTNKVIEEVNDEDQNQNLTMSVGGNSLNTRRTRTTEKQEILPLQQSLTTKRLKRPSVYQTLAVQLAQLIQIKHKTKVPDYTIEKWTKSIKKFCTESEVSTERIKAALEWCTKYNNKEYLGEYVFVIESAKHITEKLFRIEEKMNKKPYTSTKTQSPKTDLSKYDNLKEDLCYVD